MTATVTATAPLPPSPCVGLCQMDEASGFCRGCARTADEIALWRDADEATRDAIWGVLPDRAGALGISLRRLSWGAGEILDFVAESLTGSRGTWVFGTFGAVAEVMRGADEPLALVRQPDRIEAATPRAALRIVADRSTRALSWREAEGVPERIVLATPRARLGPAGPDRLTPLGADREAVRPGDRALPRFDLGLGFAEARFTVRSDDPLVLDAFAANEGATFPAHLAATGHAVLAASPTRVVETTVGRAEIDVPIPPPGGASPEGPHTHLLPALIARRLAVPPTLPLPAAYVAGAIFYPARA